MTEREIRLQALYYGRLMKIGQSVTIADFAKGAGIDVGEVVESCKWIKPYCVAESFELEFNSTYTAIVKKKSFSEIYKDELFAWQDRVKWEKKIWNLV